MGSASPLQIVAAVAVGMTILGAIIYFIRGRVTFSGYEDIAGAAREIEKVLGGELFRDGRDLVVSGNHRNLPVVVRFSYDENTPGLNVQMKAPSGFTMSVVPRGEHSTEGRVLVRTGDDMFDARYTTRSDHPTQAKMFMGKRSIAQLQKLCCSSKTFFTVTRGAIEISELVVPSDTGHHVTEHIKQMGELAEVLRTMPGADAIKIGAIEKEGRTLARVVLAVAIVAVVVTVVGAMRSRGGPEEAAAAPKIPDGVFPVDAALIPRIGNYQLVQEADVGGDALAWLRDHGQAFSARLEGDYCGKGTGNEVAYLLAGPGGRRVAMLCDGANVFDATYTNVALIARVPKDSVRSMHWTRRDKPTPDGDALLIVQKLSNGPSVIVVYRTGGTTEAAALADLENISLQ